MKKQKKSAMECASAYLENRMHTVFEVRRHLKDKEYDEAEIEETVSELIELRYLDDYAYTVRYYEYSAERGRGSRRAMRELEEKGVDKETIHNAYQDFLYENKVDEYEEALEIAHREVYGRDGLVGESDIDASDDEDSNKKNNIDEKLIARVARKLETRGFRTDDIYKVMTEMRRWKV